MSHSIYFSPAKINWFLHVTGQRADGYHTLETVFQCIDWYDELHIDTRTDGVIQLSGDLCGVADTSNLAYRAAQALRQHAHAQGFATDHLGAHIHLVKYIPTGAGLGGGSSNAATVLRVLNEQWDLHFDNATLQMIGLALGADVPFFVSQHSAAFAQGVGETLQALALVSRDVLLVNPNTHVNTGAVFTHPDLPRQHAPLTDSLDVLQAQLNHLPFQNAHSNDLEVVTFAVSPEVKAVYDTLSPLAPTRMSGSGATIMACPSSEDQRQSLNEWTLHCPAHWQFRWVKTITQCNQTTSVMKHS